MLGIALEKPGKLTPLCSLLPEYEFDEQVMNMGL